MQDGGLCESLILPAHKLHPSRTLNYHQLALVETLAIGSHAAARAQPLPGDQALIIGAGPIGLATLEFLLPRGAAVSVLDLSADRLAFCRQHYPIAHALHATNETEIREQVTAATNGERFPVVIDATGNAQSMAAALNWVAPTGTLVYVGITSDNLVFPHIAMHRPEVTLKASRNALPHDFREIISAIERGAIDTQKWITHHCPFARVGTDFAPLMEPNRGVVKALIVDFGI
jgi:alcohol dehydrogenase